MNWRMGVDASLNHYTALCSTFPPTVLVDKFIFKTCTIQKLGRRRREGKSNMSEWGACRSKQLSRYIWIRHSESMEDKRTTRRSGAEAESTAMPGLSVGFRYFFPQINSGCILSRSHAHTNIVGRENFDASTQSNKFIKIAFAWSSTETIKRIFRSFYSTHVHLEMQF